jgi:pyruvate,water dikinase
VLRNARHRVRDRENLRFERTRLFGRVRRIFLEIGKRLWAEGRLDDSRDVFYLEVREILGFIEGTATSDDLAGLARVRRRRFEEYALEQKPADRFETRGAVYIANDFLARTPRNRHAGTSNGAGTDTRDGIRLGASDESGPGAHQNQAGAPTDGSSPDLLVGLGCCPGVVRGPVRVIRDPRGASLEDGEILVAERTDPGWILLFPSAAAILVERGSLLSHSAIVAREMGIPAIVSIPGITELLRDGEWVEMDGSSGEVRRIPAGQS